MRRTLLAGSLGAIALTVTAVSIPLSLGREPLYETLVYTVLGVTLALTGTLIAARVGRNAIGWILLVMALETGAGEALEGWGMHPDLAGSPMAAWTAASLVYFGIGMFPVLLLLFPGGTLPSRRWRVPLVLSLAAIPISVVASAFSHFAQRARSTEANPLAIAGPVADMIFVASQVIIVGGFGTAIASLVMRYRRAGPLERQQLKWVGFSTGLLVALAPFALAFYYSSVLVQIAIAPVVAFLPITIGIAVLRFRLYDIDRIISRTASYAIVTVLIGGTYALVVVSVTAVLPGLPAVGVAIATLVAAALSLPLLRRVQGVVNRRFDRERYDAGKLVDAFGQRLRSGANPHSVSLDLVGAVEQALQPAAVGLWTRPDDVERAPRTALRPER